MNFGSASFSELPISTLPAAVIPPGIIPLSGTAETAFDGRGTVNLPNAALKGSANTAFDNTKTFVGKKRFLIGSANTPIGNPSQTLGRKRPIAGSSNRAGKGIARQQPGRVEIVLNTVNNVDAFTTSLPTWTNTPIGISRNQLKPNRQYLVVMMGSIAFQNSAGLVFEYRMFNQATGAAVPQTDAKLFIGQSDSWDNHGKQIWSQFKLTTGATTSDLRLQIQNSSWQAGDEAKFYNCRLWLLDLNALGVEGVDWWYAEETATKPLDGTGGLLANVTVNSDLRQDLWVSTFARAGQSNPSLSNEYQMQLHENGVSLVTQETEDTDTNTRQNMLNGLYLLNRHGTFTYGPLFINSSLSGKSYYSNVFVMRAAVAKRFWGNNGTNPGFGTAAWLLADTKAWTTHPSSTRTIVLFNVRSAPSGGNQHHIHDVSTSASGGNNTVQAQQPVTSTNTYPAHSSQWASDGTNVAIRFNNFTPAGAGAFSGTLRHWLRRNTSETGYSGPNWGIFDISLLTASEPTPAVTHALTGNANTAIGGTGTLITTGPSGNTISLDGSANNVFTNAGTLVSKRPLGVGSADTVVEGTGTLTARVPLAGAADTVIDATGTLRSLIRMTGAADSVIDGTGVLSRTVLVSGSGAVAVAGTGALSSLVDLSGSFDTALDGSGVISDVGTFVGTIPVVHDGTGSLSAQLRISGDADVAVDGVGELAATVPLVGSGAFVSDGQGTLSVVRFITSSADSVFDASSSELSTFVSLGGSTDTAFDGGATLSSIKPLSGSAAAVFTAAGQIATSLSGSADTALTGTGTLTFRVPLAGSCELAVDASGQPSAIRATRGAASALFDSGTSKMASLRSLAGDADTVVDGTSTLGAITAFDGSADVASDGTATVSALLALGGSYDFVVYTTGTLRPTLSDYERRILTEGDEPPDLVSAGLVRGMPLSGGRMYSPLSGREPPPPASGTEPERPLDGRERGEPI